MSELALLGGLPEVTIPISDWKSIGSMERLAVNKVFDRSEPLSGFYGSPQPGFFGGTEIRLLEEEWKERFGSKYAVSVNSASSGLIAAMGAIGISPGDEVIVPAYTMSATAVAPIFYGGIPVFVDIEKDYFCLDVEAVTDAITERTKAILVVNLFGHPAQLKKLRDIADQHSIYLVEDNAQAILAEEDGMMSGHVGHIGVYSFNVHKHIQAGEGGMCVTSDAELAQRLQLIRNHGENVVDWLDVKNISNIVGYNFRQTEIGAAILRSQLRRIDELVGRAENIAEKLSQGIKGLSGITVPKVRTGCRHNYFMWTARFDKVDFGCTREKFIEAIRAEGVPMTAGYVKPIYRLPIFSKGVAMGKNGYPFNITGQKYPDGLCPVTEKMHEQEVIQFQPVSWNPDEKQLVQIITAFHKVYENASKL